MNLISFSAMKDGIYYVEKNYDNEWKSFVKITVKNDKIITIATTQFENQKLENIEKFLVDLTKTIELKNNKEFCKK